MKNKIGFLFVTTFAQLMMVSSWGQPKELLPAYHLKVQIDPALSRLECKTEIQNPQDSGFFLNNNVKIRRIVADGKPISFQQKPSAAAANSSEISLTANIPKNLVIEYSGQLNAESLPKSVSLLNMIKAELVELSNYIDWYPRMKNFKAFTYTLDANVPLNYVTVANGLLKEEKSHNDRHLARWESDGPNYGITFLSAPNLHKAAITQNGLTVEIYYGKLPAAYIDSMKSNLIKAMERLVDLYGKPGNNTLVRVIYSPRFAGGYARSPLILVSENFALEQLPHEFGPARDLRLNIHEIAHYWSRADTNTAEDWINEGLAEYSALLVSEEIVGKDFSDLLLSEYRDMVNNSQSDNSILETDGNSRDREVNRYYKPTILLNDVRQKYGDEKVRRFIKALYARFLETNSANTTLFLEEMEKNIGKDARDYFSEALYRKRWNDAETLTSHAFSPSDALFLGRWTGPLTQFGATTQFVLNLNVKEEKLIATLDSPDQNVKDIPVAEVNIVGDSLFLKVGVASATYEGRLNRDTMMILGEWKQRGITYPLNLSKKNEVK